MVKPACSRSHAGKMNKRTSQINSLRKGPHEGKVAAVGGSQPRQSADARHRMMLAKVLCGGLCVRQYLFRRRCLSPLDVSCCVRLQWPRWRLRLWWWSNVHCPFPRAMTKGGRGLVRYQGVRRQRSNPDRSLPPHMLQLPGASQRVPRCAHEIFS